MSVTTKMNEAADLQLMSNVNGPSYAAGVQAAGGGGGGGGGSGGGGTRGKVLPSLVLMEQSAAQPGKKAGNDPSSVQPSTRGKSVSVNPSVQTQPSARGKSVSVNPSSVGGGSSAKPLSSRGGASSVEPSSTQGASTASSAKPSSRQVGSTVEPSSTQGGSTASTSKPSSRQAGGSVKPSTRGASQAEGKSTSSMRGGGSRGSSINPDLNTSASAGQITAVNPSQRTMQGIDSISKPDRVVGGGGLTHSRMVAKLKGKKSVTVAR